MRNIKTAEKKTMGNVKAIHTNIQNVNIVVPMMNSPVKNCLMIVFICIGGLHAKLCL